MLLLSTHFCLCSYKLTEWAAKKELACQKKERKMNQLAEHCRLWKPPTPIITAMNPGERCSRDS